MKINYYRFSFLYIAGLFLAHGIWAESSAPEYAIQQIAVYSLQPGKPAFISTVDTPAKELSVYNATLSEWIEVGPPVYFSYDQNSSESSAWVPSSQDSHEWVIILNQGVDGRPHVAAFPKNKSEPASLLIGNLMPHAIQTTYGEREQNIDPFSFESLPLRNSRFSLEARTAGLPYHCSISTSGIDPATAYLLLIAPPHVKGSPIMTHRMVKIPSEF